MTLVDAEAHEELGPLVRGSTVNLADLDTTQLSAVLTWSGSPNVKSVAFYLDSASITATENAAPWSLLGDTRRGGRRYYTPWAATPGDHTIVAELFDKKNRRGGHLCAVTYTFTIVDGVRTPADPAPVSSMPTTSPTPSPTRTPTVLTPGNVPLMLVDASTVPATDLHLVTGDAIRLTSIGTSKISIRYEYAMVSSEPPASVIFDVSGTGAGFPHVETSAPFTLLGDKRRKGKYAAWSPDAGVYELTVTAFAGNGEVLNEIVTTLTIDEGPVTNKRAKYATKVPKLAKTAKTANGDSEETIAAGASHDDASSNSATEGATTLIGLDVAVLLVVFASIVAVFRYYGKGQGRSPELAGVRQSSDDAASALSDRSSSTADTVMSWDFDYQLLNARPWSSARQSSTADTVMSWDLDYQLLNAKAVEQRPAVMDVDALASTASDRFVHAPLASPVNSIGGQVDLTGSRRRKLTTRLGRNVSLDWDDSTSTWT
jgi:hypothetical protein